MESAIVKIIMLLQLYEEISMFSHKIIKSHSFQQAEKTLKFKLLKLENGNDALNSPKKSQFIC